MICPRCAGDGHVPTPTALAMAHDVAKWLREDYLDSPGADVSVWDADKVREMGWGSANADAAVAFEGAYDWTVELTLSDHCHAAAERLRAAHPGQFMEPYSGWLLYIYDDGKAS